MPKQHTYVLGLNTYDHDVSACLLKDGAIAVAIAKELNLPIRYVGVGEQVNDLMVFDPESYVNGLFN